MVLALIRFRLVEIDSNVCFVRGKRRKCLRYVVRSVMLETKTKAPDGTVKQLPEIFWQ